MHPQRFLASVHFILGRSRLGRDIRMALDEAISVEVDAHPRCLDIDRDRGGHKFV